MGVSGGQGWAELFEYVIGVDLSTGGSLNRQPSCAITHKRLRIGAPSSAALRYSMATSPPPLMTMPDKNVPQSENRYLNTIFRISEKYLQKCWAPAELDALTKRATAKINGGNKRETIQSFCDLYHRLAKKNYQAKYKHIDVALDKFLHGKKNARHVKIVWGDCLQTLRAMKSESVHLMVTSPPYYNAREYSHWKNLDAYLDDMREIITECYRVLDNHRAFVFNVGDIFDNDFQHTNSSWGKRRIPLGAYFTLIFEQAGFRFVDDFIWDKGEVESQRHKNGDTPYPLYQYPMNCYEHVFVFYKHRRDTMLYPCPVCGCLKVNGNAYSGVGIKSWECKNLKCDERSKANRGKRFSARSVNMNALKTSDNQIDAAFVKKWRRDIVKINPVIKINSKGENTLGHTAPFPVAIPEYAIKMLSGVGESVLDPFAGSFTTAIEAQKLLRNGIGIELNKKTFRKAIIANMNRNVTFNRWSEYDVK